MDLQSATPNVWKLPTYAADSKIDTDFIVSMHTMSPGYLPIPFDPKNPRAIPFPDGPYGTNRFIEVSDSGKKVTFNMQQGSTLEGYNGTYPDAMIQFLIDFLDQKNTGALKNDYTTTAIKHLNEARLALFQRGAERHFRNVQGTYKP